MRHEIKKSYPSLHLVGKNGMHKYNNQDHAMMTDILTVKNLVAKEDIYDIWKLNQDAEYHEEEKNLNQGDESYPIASKNNLIFYKIPFDEPLPLIPMKNHICFS